MAQKEGKRGGVRGGAACDLLRVRAKMRGRDILVWASGMGKRGEWVRGEAPCGSVWRI